MAIEGSRWLLLRDSGFPAGGSGYPPWMLSIGGDRLLGGRYRLGALVGRGAMADVHRAHDVRLERPVAIKVFSAEGSATDRRRFEDEARLLAGMRHSGLVTVYEAGEDDGVRYLVMQLVDGPSLRAALEREKPTLDEVLALGRQLLPTLAYVHGRGVVHRDVKPSNILLDLEGKAYLADFGLARLVDAAGITKSGEVVGTAAYLAPEQVRGEMATMAVDVYAVGLVLLQCLTGQLEFPGTQSESALARLTRDPVIPGDLPEAIAGLLGEMTSFDPERRPDAEECAARWEGLDAPVGRSRRSRVVGVLTAGVLTVGLGLGVVLGAAPPTRAPGRPEVVVVPPSSAPAVTTTASTSASSVRVVGGGKGNHGKKGKPPGRK